jgi:hypothetical protein
MGVKDDFSHGDIFKIGNGQKTRLWEDVWLGEQPLAQSISLYHRAVKKCFGCRCVNWGSSKY